VMIYYDILNYQDGDVFNVWVEISDNQDRRVKAQALRGDIGRNIPGGSGKTIAWSPEEDGYQLVGGIYVQIFAELIKPEKKSVTPPAASAEKRVRTGAIVAQSLILPGLGLSRETGQPHWVRGVAGYGCLAGSLALNRMASSTYELYQAENNPATRDELFSKAQTQDMSSEILAFTAAGIWVTDIIWNLLACKKMNQDSFSQDRGLQLIPAYNPVSRGPMLALYLRF
jgi:hypothetical protein